LVLQELLWLGVYPTGFFVLVLNEMVLVLVLEAV